MIAHAIWVHDPDFSADLQKDGFYGPFRNAHKTHPCTLWACKNYRNLVWLMDLLNCLHHEYQRRYGYDKYHKAYMIWSKVTLDPKHKDRFQKFLETLYTKTTNSKLELILNLDKSIDTANPQFALAMPEVFHGSTTYQNAYRNYYLNDKISQLEWYTKDSKKIHFIPEWVTAFDTFHELIQPHFANTTRFQTRKYIQKLLPTTTIDWYLYDRFIAYIERQYDIHVTHTTAVNKKTKLKQVYHLFSFPPNSDSTVCFVKPPATIFNYTHQLTFGTVCTESVMFGAERGLATTRLTLAISGKRAFDLCVEKGSSLYVRPDTYLNARI